MHSSKLPAASQGCPWRITAWDRAIVQKCVIHLLRNIFRYASRKYWDQIAKDIHPVYTAVSEAQILL